MPQAGLWLAGPDDGRIPILRGFFFQFLNHAGLPARSHKLNQYDEIDALIEERFLPMQWVQEYWHTTGTIEDFSTEARFEDLYNFMVLMKNKYGQL
jgi:hypothetical protein